MFKRAIGDWEGARRDQERRDSYLTPTSFQRKTYDQKMSVKRRDLSRATYAYPKKVTTVEEMPIEGETFAQRQRGLRFEKIRAMGYQPGRVGSIGYVNRTAGGQVNADNQYFDTERTITALVATTSSWANSEFDPNTSAMLCLFAPVKGNGIDNRQGNKVFFTKKQLDEWNEEELLNSYFTGLCQEDQNLWQTYLTSPDGTNCR